MEVSVSSFDACANMRQQPECFTQSRSRTRVSGLGLHALVKVHVKGRCLHATCRVKSLLTVIRLCVPAHLLLLSLKGKAGALDALQGISCCGSARGGLFRLWTQTPLNHLNAQHQQQQQA